MKEKISLGIAVVALILSIASISAAFINTQNTIEEYELLDNSVTSDNVVDGTLIGNDIANNAITLSHLSQEVIDAMTGGTFEIPDGSIMNIHISNTADIDPSKIDGTAWTSENDGYDSGLDADMLDGIQESQFIRSDTSGSINGDFTVNGDLTWQNKTSYISISTAAFVPREDGYDYYNNGAYIQNIDGNSDDYYAPVQLPHGATVTNMTFYWEDYSSSYNGLISMAKRPPLSAIQTMASVYSSGNSGKGISYDDTIEYAVIDNYHNCYYMGLHIYDSNIKCYGVIIEYTFTEPY